jgi:polyhydroxyalkanoate synthesis regulator protein
MEMFEKAFAMFTPFARGGQEKPAEDKPQAGGGSGGEMDQLKRQLEEMQQKIDRLSNKDQ